MQEALENNFTNQNSLKTSLDKVSFYVLLFVTFLIPIFFIPADFISPQFGTSLLFAFGIILAGLLYIVSTLSSGSISLLTPSKFILGFTFLVPIVYVVAGLANGFSRLSFLGYTFDISTVGFIVISFVYLFLVSVLFNSKEKIFFSYLAFVLSAIIFSLFLAVRLIWGVSVFSFGLFTTLTSTTIGTWNNVGIFFGIGVILSLLTYEMVNVSNFLKVLLTLSLASSLFFLALVNFSIIWIIIGICSFLFILFRVFNLENETYSIFKRFTKIPLYSSVVLIVSIVFVVWGSTLGVFLSNKLKVTNVEIRPSFSATLDIAKNTLSARPIFGSGPNTFINQWMTWKPNDVVSTIFWNIDFTNGIGLIPTFAVTTGVLGLFSWIIFLGFYIYLGFKSIFGRFEDGFIKYLVTSSFFVSLYLWIMSVCYIPSTVVFALTFFFTGLFFASVYTGGVVELHTKVFSNNSKIGFLSSLFLVTVFIGSLVLGFGLYQNSKSLWFYQKSSFALNKEGNVDLSEKYMQEAVALVSYDVYHRALSEIELVKLNNIANQDPKKVKTEDIQKQFNETLSNAIKAGLAAQKSDPSNYLNWISLGRVYENVSSPNLKIKGAYESSELAYIEALKRNPKNPAILVLLSRLAASQGDYVKAKDYAIQAIQIKNNYLDGYFVLSQIEVATNNIRGAIEAVTASSIIDPTNPAIFFQLGLLKYNQKDYNGAISAFEKAVSMAKDYANAKYFLGLSYEIVGEHQKAIDQFTELKVTNPDSKDVDGILENLKSGKPLFTNSENTNPEKGKALPVNERES